MDFDYSSWKRILLEHIWEVAVPFHQHPESRLQTLWELFANRFFFTLAGVQLAGENTILLQPILLGHKQMSSKQQKTP